MNLNKIKFSTYLSVISILGFVTILVQALSGPNIGEWVNSTLFFLIGLSLFISGGWHLIFHYFKNGLSANEINKIVSVIVGVASMFVGILTSPGVGINYPVFDGIKVVISGVAILVIFLDMLKKQTK